MEELETYKDTMYSHGLIHEMEVPSSYVGKVLMRGLCTTEQEIPCLTLPYARYCQGCGSTDLSSI